MSKTKITQAQILKMYRKMSREDAFDDGWVASKKPHRSAKDYSRKRKFEDDETDY